MSVFYERFERHAHGEGLKGAATHYCPGCGHGLVHRYLAEAIEELGIQDRTVAISPVGCSVFLYYYLDVGNTQAAHGRAPAVALGHKLANPDVDRRQLPGRRRPRVDRPRRDPRTPRSSGMPITVDLRQQRDLRHDRRPDGADDADGPEDHHLARTAATPRMGQPMKMAELIAAARRPGLRGAGGALRREAARRGRRRRSRRRSQLQVENRGFAFVEVLAECPTHLRLTPEEAERWVREQMVPVFPLGVKKDVTADARAGSRGARRPSIPARVARRRSAASPRPSPRFCDGVPGARSAARDIALKLAGAGGDGAQTAAMLIARAAINEGFDATHIPSYGPESRGGTSYADVRIAERRGALARRRRTRTCWSRSTRRAWRSSGRTVRAGRDVIYDSSVIRDAARARPRRPRPRRAAHRDRRRRSGSRS